MNWRQSYIPNGCRHVILKNPWPAYDAVSPCLLTKDLCADALMAFVRFRFACFWAFLSSASCNASIFWIASLSTVCFASSCARFALLILLPALTGGPLSASDLALPFCLRLLLHLSLCLPEDMSCKSWQTVYSLGSAWSRMASVHHLLFLLSANSTVDFNLVFLRVASTNTTTTAAIVFFQVFRLSKIWHSRGKHVQFSSIIYILRVDLNPLKKKVTNSKRDDRFSNPFLDNITSQPWSAATCPRTTASSTLTCLF